MVTLGADPGFSQSGPQPLRPKFADVAEWSNASEVSYLQPLKDLGSFFIFNAQICILPHSRDPFSLVSNIYFDIRNLKFILFEKWRAEQSEAEQFLNLNYEKIAKYYGNYMLSEAR